MFCFCWTQGVTCILSVLREGVLTGSPEQKEEAAKALGGVIRLTSPEALRPSVVNITGPLIRILGDRFAWTVKTALLETLTLLLAKVRGFIAAEKPQRVAEVCGGCLICCVHSTGGNRPEALPTTAADHLPEGPAGFQPWGETKGRRGSGSAGLHPQQGWPTLHWATLSYPQRWGLWSQVSQQVRACFRTFFSSFNFDYRSVHWYNIHNSNFLYFSVRRPQSALHYI